MLGVFLILLVRRLLVFLVAGLHVRDLQILLVASFRFGCLFFAGAETVDQHFDVDRSGICSFSCVAYDRYLCALECDLRYLYDAAFLAARKFDQTTHADIDAHLFECK